jgi:hypothetical protein
VADRDCGNCGHELRQDDRFCPSCGRAAHEVAQVPTPEADVSVSLPPQGTQGVSDPTDTQRSWLWKWWPFAAVVLAFVLLASTVGGNSGGGSGSGGGSQPSDQQAGGGSKQHTSNNTSADEQIIERGKAAREREQEPRPGHAPLPKGDTLEVYYKATGGAGYEAYAGADGIKQPVYFTGPHYGDEHIIYHADHNPAINIDVTRMTVSGAVEVTVVHEGKQIAHAVADDSNHNVTIMGIPHDLTVQ